MNSAHLQLGLALVCLVHTARAQLPFDLLNMQLHTIRNAEARGAVCNDGTPAKYYFRDCPRPGAECLTAPADWIVVFQGDTTAETCFDAASCAARPANATSSAGLNGTLMSPDGIFSTSGEENPNFYQHRTVLVPACSSDMWLGNATAAFSIAGQQQPVAFRGAAIARAVFEDLSSATFSPRSVPTPYGPGPNHTRLADADSVTVVGGAGIMSQLAAIAALLPPRPAAKFRAICDGCVVAGDAPFAFAPAQGSCTDAAECAPVAVLRAGFPVWRPLATAGAWHALLGAALLAALPHPTLVQQPIFDARQLRQLGAWPPSAANGAYVDAFGATMRALLRGLPHGGRYAFGTACSPSQPSFLESKDRFFCLPVACQLTSPSAGTTTNTTLKLANVVSMFLKDPTFLPACVDDCAGVNCNAHCDAPLCWG